MSYLHLHLMLLVFISTPSAWSYQLPIPDFVIYFPSGFEVSVPDVEGITSFTFNGKLNAELDDSENGTWFGVVPRAKKGRWRFRNYDTHFDLRDTIYYRICVRYNGKDYRENDGEFKVDQFNAPLPDISKPIPSTPCTTTPTTVNGAPVRCSGQIIFEENFSSSLLDSSKWTVERRIPQQPDYEFNVYFEDIPDVLHVQNGKLVIVPKATNQLFPEDALKKFSTLGHNCTARLDTDECTLYPWTRIGRLNPYITAQLGTKNKFSFKYGRVVINAKLPGAMWALPQLWLQPAKLLYGDNNYHSGQMRVAQTIVNGDETLLAGGLLLNSDEPWRTAKMCQHKSKNLNLTQGFHLYELNWTPNFVAVAVDGEEYCRIEVPDEAHALKNLHISGTNLPNRYLLNSGSKWAPFDQEFYLTLGYGIGGNNDFRDDINWKEEKPWTNSNPRSKIYFWNKYKNNMNWLSNGDLQVDYVKVYAV